MKISKLIKDLEYLHSVYGDLPVIIAIDFKKSELILKDDSTVISADNLFLAYDQNSDRSDEIRISSFPY
jgi:hypothetical protein